MARKMLRLLHMQKSYWNKIVHSQRTRDLLCQMLRRQVCNQMYQMCKGDYFAVSIFVFYNYKRVMQIEYGFQSSLFSFIFRLSHKEESHIETNHGTVSASLAQIVKNRQLVSVLHPEMISHIVLIVLENFFQNVAPHVANQ